MDGPGGSGKTFLYNTIIAYYRSQHQIVIPVASSGIAALLLDGGSTAHSRFRIPVLITEASSANINLQSPEAEILRQASIIIWDEASMANKLCYECVDRLLRDIMKRVDPSLQFLPFGGKKFLVGGDFRQTLPVVNKGSRADIIYATLKSSYLWRHVQQFQLVTNMRLLNPDSASYRDFIMQIGNGTLPTQSFLGTPDHIEIPRDIWMPLNKEDLFDNIFDDFQTNYNDPEYLSKRAILSPLNKNTDEINNIASSLLPGDFNQYLSIDSTIEDGGDNTGFPTEYLQTLDISGLPHHNLQLKLDQAIILLRNISNARGLCNGTRLIIKSNINYLFTRNIYRLY